MTTQEVANRFYELSETGQFDLIYQELFSPDARSIEPAGGGFPEANNLAEIIQNGKDWAEQIEAMHGGYTGVPVVAGNYFTCAMGMDVTMKGQARMQLDEIAVYHVRDGKIVSQQFFYE